MARNTNRHRTGRQVADGNRESSPVPIRMQRTVDINAFRCQDLPSAIEQVDMDVLETSVSAMEAFRDGTA